MKLLSTVAELKEKLFTREYEVFLKEFSIFSFNEKSIENILLLASTEDYNNNPSRDKMDLIQSSFCLKGSKFNANFSSEIIVSLDKQVAHELDLWLSADFVNRPSLVDKARKLKVTTSAYDFQHPTRQRSNAMVVSPNATIFEGARNMIIATVQRDTLSRFNKLPVAQPVGSSVLSSILNSVSRKTLSGAYSCSREYFESFKAFLDLMHNNKMVVPGALREIKEKDFKTLTNPQVPGGVKSTHELGW